MTVIKINAITVPEDSGDELGRRFAARAGAVDAQDGFEGFELLKPTDGRTTWLDVTRAVRPVLTTTPDRGGARRPRRRGLVRRRRQRDRRSVGAGCPLATGAAPAVPVVVHGCGPAGHRRRGGAGRGPGRRRGPGGAP